MFLEILRALEGLATKFTLVRFQGDMDSDVRGDMVAFDGGGTATTPLTRQVEIVGTLAADVSFADMFLREQSARRGRSTLGAMAAEGFNSRRAPPLSCFSRRNPATGIASFHPRC
jgi:hypothetical protein